MDKRGIELSFSIIFAIIAGAVILFLAIYAAIKFIDSGNTQGQTVAAKELSIVFDPLESGQETGKSTKAELSMDTRLYTDCSESGSFGSQSFSLSQKTGLSKNWPKPGVPIKVNNKYVFSEGVEEGKTFYFFVKPFKEYILPNYDKAGGEGKLFIVIMQEKNAFDEKRWKNVVQKVGNDAKILEK